MRIHQKALITVGTGLLLSLTTGLWGASKFEGRWNVDETADGRTSSSWLEVNADGSGWYLHRGGHPMPARIEIADGRLHVQMLPEGDAPANPERKMPSLEGRLEGDRLVGTGLSWNDKPFQWIGVRPPDRHDGSDRQVTWGEPIDLLANGNLTAWKTADKRQSQWMVENGLLVNQKSGANLRTVKEFRDFKLHLEFMIPPGSNSGIYLRGRYETQVADDYGKEPFARCVGGIYGRLTPKVNAVKPAGEWNSVDVQIIGYRVWVTINGQQTLDGAVIEGITGGALDTRESEPGPLMLQGDHGTVSYRNVVITPAR